jgi:hypothetical protein
MKNGELESKGSNTYSVPRIKCSEHLVRFWRDLHDDQIWKYEELCPIELLEEAEVDHRTLPKDELDRIAWFWRRRPPRANGSRLDSVADCGRGSPLLRNSPMPGTPDPHHVHGAAIVDDCAVHTVAT